MPNLYPRFRRKRPLTNSRIRWKRAYSPPTPAEAAAEAAIAAAETAADAAATAETPDGKASPIVTPTAAAAVAAVQDSPLTQSVPAALAAVPAVAAAVVPSRETITEAAPVVPAVAAAVAGITARSREAVNAVDTTPKKVVRTLTAIMVKMQAGISTDLLSAAEQVEKGRLPALQEQVKVARAVLQVLTEAAEPS